MARLALDLNTSVCLCSLPGVLIYLVSAGCVQSCLTLDVEGVACVSGTRVVSFDYGIDILRAPRMFLFFAVEGVGRNDLGRLFIQLTNKF